MRPQLAAQNTDAVAEERSGRLLYIATALMAEPAAGRRAANTFPPKMRIFVNLFELPQEYLPRTPDAPDILP